MSTPEQPDNKSSESSESPENIEKNELSDTDEAVDERSVGLAPGELDELRATFVRAESRRRRRALLGGVLVLAALVGFFWLMMTHGETTFGTSVEKGEQDVMAETNDPVCRGVIADVTETGKRFFEKEGDIERSL